MLRLATVVLALSFAATALGQAVEMPANADKLPPLKNAAEMLSVVPDGVIPDRMEQWNEVKRKVVVDALQGMVGRKIQVQGVVWHIRSDGDQPVIHVGPSEKLNISPLFFAYFSDDNALAIARLAVGDAVNIEGTISELRLQRRDNQLSLEVRLGPTKLVAATPKAKAPEAETMKNIERLLAVIRADILPAREDQWNAAKRRVANSDLATAVGARLRVEGHFLDVSIAPGGALAVQIGGLDRETHTVSLYANFSADQDVAIARLKAGDAITVEGTIGQAQFAEQQNVRPRAVLNVRLDDAKLVP